MHNLRKNRIVITGASGFIGSNLVKKLLENGYKNLLAIDLNKSSILPIDTMIGNFSDRKLLNKAIKKDDIVIHLACSTVPSLSEKNKEKDIEDNVMGTSKLLKICAEKKIKKFIFFSSGGTIYGEQNQPVNEKTKTSPINSHGQMKLMIENNIKKFNQRHNLNYIIIRLSNPYGRKIENHKNQGLIDIFLKKIINHETLEIWGDGKIIRDYIHIDDLSNSILKLIKKDINNEILNVGTGVGTSINEAIDIIQKISKQKIKVKYLQKRNFDISYNVLDIKKAKTILNWKPTIDLKKGIEKIYNKLKK